MPCRRSQYNLHEQKFEININKQTLKTLMTVPFSEAVATFVPLGLNARAANGLSCAGIIIFACCK